MLFVILMVLEGLCIIPLLIIRLRRSMNNDEEAVINLNVAFVIVASIINWFSYGSLNRGLFFYTGGYYGDNEVNVVGLLWSVCPPLIVVGISYTSFQIIRSIRGNINLAKYRKRIEQEEKEEEQRRDQIKSIIDPLGLEEFWRLLSVDEQEMLIRYSHDIYISEAKSSQVPTNDTITDSCHYIKTQLSYLDAVLVQAVHEERYAFADKIIKQGDKSIEEGKLYTRSELHNFLQDAIACYFLQREFREDYWDYYVRYFMRNAEEFPHSQKHSALYREAFKLDA